MSECFIITFYDLHQVFLSADVHDLHLWQPSTQQSLRYYYYYLLVLLVLLLHVLLLLLLLLLLCG